jgi:acetyl-CoA carboxylase biotin carboxyl carrier protein
VLTFEQIKELINLVTERRLQGLEIERSGFRLRIEGKARANVVQVEAAAPAVRESTPAAVVSQSAAAPAPASSSAHPEEKGPPEGAHIQPSPIVGTFYAAPGPDADNYVKVGDSISKGQVLCIVEAMKLMNEIEADVSGKLIEIYPSNAQPVEYGEPLFAILPS